ncbi:MAG TPA: DUF4116 domain-containing protein, partial [Campylobacterales bacterium]|nr:DUF4116 domain-containing protein [Campylobacterales bacterium]
MTPKGDTMRIRLLWIITFLTLLFSTLQAERLYKNRETVLWLIQHDVYLFSNLDPIYQNDKEIVLKAMQQDASVYNLLDISLKKDPDVLALAVVSGFGLEHDTSGVLEDRQKVQRLLQLSADTIKEINNTQWTQDRELMLELLENEYAYYSHYYTYIDQSLKEDINFTLDALTATKGFVFSHLNEPMKKHPQILSKALEYGYGVEYADKALRSDKQRMIELMKQNASVCQHVDPSLLRDRTFALVAIEQNSDCLEFIDPSLLNEKHFIAPLLHEYPGLIRELNSTVLEDDTFMRPFLLEFPEYLSYASETLRQDENLTRTLLEQSPYLIYQIDAGFRNNKAFMLPYLNENPEFFPSIGKRLAADEAFVSDFFRRHHQGFQYLTETERQDTNLIKQALDQNYDAFAYVHPSLKQDKAFVLELIASGYDIFFEINATLKNDPEVLLSYLKHTGAYAVYDINRSFFKDETFVQHALEEAGFGLEYATQAQQQDRTLVLNAVQKNPHAFRYAHYFSNDKEMAKIAVDADSFLFRYCSDAIKKDKEFILSSAMDYNILNEMDTSLAEDKSFALQLLHKDPQNFYYVNQTLKNDPDVVFAYLEKSYSDESINEVNASLFEDRAFLNEVLEETGCGMQYATPEQKRDTPFILSLLNKNCSVLPHIDGNLTDNRDFMEKAIEEDSYNLQYASDRLKKDQALVLTAIEEYAHALSYADQNLTLDATFMRKAIEINGYALLYAGEALQNDRKLALQAIQSDPYVYSDENFHFKKDREIAMEAFEAEAYLLQDAPNALKKDREFIKTLIQENPKALSYASETLQKDAELQAIVKEQEFSKRAFWMTLIYVILLGLFILRTLNAKRKEPNPQRLLSNKGDNVMVWLHLSLLGLYYLEPKVAMSIALITIPWYLYRLGRAYSLNQALLFMIFPMLLVMYLSLFILLISLSLFWGEGARTHGVLFPTLAVLIYLVFWVMGMIVCQIMGYRRTRMERLLLGLVVLLLVT